MRTTAFVAVIVALVSFSIGFEHGDRPHYRGAIVLAWLGY